MNIGCASMYNPECGGCRYFFNPNAKGGRDRWGECLKISLAVNGPYGPVKVPMWIPGRNEACSNFEKAGTGVSGAVAATMAAQNTPGDSNSKDQRCSCSGGGLHLQVKASAQSRQPVLERTAIYLDPDVRARLEWFCDETKQEDYSDGIAELVEIFDQCASPYQRFL